MEAEGIWRTLVLGSLGLGSAYLRRAWNWSSTFSWTIWVSPCMNFPVFRGGGYTEASTTYRGAGIKTEMWPIEERVTYLAMWDRQCSWPDQVLAVFRLELDTLVVWTSYHQDQDHHTSHLTHRNIDNKIHKYEIYIKDNNCKFIIYYIFLSSRLRLFHFSNVLPWFPEFL